MYISNGLMNHIRNKLKNKSNFIWNHSKKFTTNETIPDLIITNAAIKRLKEINNQKKTNKKLRIGVDGGGCSGFQYNFTLEDTIQSDDIIFNKDDCQVLIDRISMDFIKGSTLDYEQEMIRSAFIILNNPNAESGCGCGSSFSLK